MAELSQIISVGVVLLVLGIRLSDSDLEIWTYWLDCRSNRVHVAMAIDSEPGCRGRTLTSLVAKDEDRAFPLSAYVWCHFPSRTVGDLGMEGTPATSDRVDSSHF